MALSYYRFLLIYKTSFPKRYITKVIEVTHNSKTINKHTKVKIKQDLAGQRKQPVEI
jgi:hypothetical protein